MKTKPISGKIKPLLIILACFIVIVCAFFFVRFKYFGKAEKGDITLFLTNFNSALKGGHTDTVLNYFETPKNPKAVRLLISLLAGETGLNGKSAATFKVTFNPQDNKILYSNSEITVVRVPVSFFGDSVDEKISFITFTIHKTGDHLYKIIKVKSDLFLEDYIAYANLIRDKTVPETAIYSAITLASFKIANSLKARYDSVIWFEHVGEKTYYYVIKGTLNNEFYWGEQRSSDYEPTYKMGLVGPDLKEIIPPDYDLIHNVGGTIDGMIEVDKGIKRGLYSVSGKQILPVNYDQIFPLNDNENLALLRNGDDYFYLKADSTVTEKISAFKIGDILKKIKIYGNTYTLSDKTLKSTMEYNSRDNFNSLIISPSYLVDLKLQDQFIDLRNPLRKLNGEEADDPEGFISLKIEFNSYKQNTDSWLESAFYSLYSSFIDGRSGLYESNKAKNVIVVDNKQNRLLGFNAQLYMGDEEGIPTINTLCDENSIRAINDSLYEFKTTSQVSQQTLTDTIDEVPYYHYLYIKNEKLEALPNGRIFGFTKYVKMDDSYMEGCYVVNGKATDHITKAMLEYMKNEIFASYHYKFKNDAWTKVFEGRFNRYDDSTRNTNVDDSLTTIDKYNINWIVQKLKTQGTANKLATVK